MTNLPREIDLSDEDRYWREHYNSRQYFGRNYDEYQPAYRYGWESAARPENQGRKFEDVEEQLRLHWQEFTGTSRTDWPYMRDAVRAGYNRIQRRLGVSVEYRPPEAPPQWENVKGNLYNTRKLPDVATPPEPNPSPGDALRKDGNKEG